MIRSLTKPQQLCAAYVFAHALTHFSARWFEVQPGISTSIWYPPGGLALAFLVLLGPRYVPVVLLANLATAMTGASSQAVWSVLFFPTLLTANYATAAWLVRRWLGPRLLPGTTRGTAVFCATIVVAPLVTTLIGTAVATIMNPRPASFELSRFLESVFNWWIGDATGLLTVVPAAMVFVGPWLDGPPATAGRRVAPSRALGLAALRGAALLGTLVLVLLVPALREQRAFYLCFLPLVWICMYHGLPGATLATLSVMIVGVIGLRLAGTTVASSYVFLLFEVAVAGVGLGLGTAVTRRNEAEAQLAASNAELARLHRLELDEKIAAQLSEEKARLEVLRYQLNPHFLYNSLNSVYGLLFENARDAGEMVLRLSEFCRATLTGNRDELPMLGAEVDALRSYLDVEKVRWGEKLEIAFAVEPEAEAVRLPTFLLLPLVENAIKYGGRTPPGVLRPAIRAQREDGALLVEIANTGAWVPPGPPRPDSTGIGLENLRQRLQRYYPDTHTFTTEEQDGWVVVRLRLTGDVALRRTTAESSFA
ncbi:MAG: MASE1 domain-containing protein [Undibacterium sp.]|nr:MASE1 domain-containing protein [Opitutaceae bacterium]